MPTSAPAPYVASARPAVLTANLMRCRQTALFAGDMYRRGIKVDRVPGKFTYLGSPEAMPVGDKDHGGVTVAITIILSGLDQLLDLGLGGV